jgi:hypothetical protein
MNAHINFIVNLASEKLLVAVPKLSIHQEPMLSPRPSVPSVQRNRSLGVHDLADFDKTIGSFAVQKRRPGITVASEALADG